MILITACGAVIICLAGAIAAVAFALRKNPLAEGLMELAKEVTALEEEMGEHFWTDALNQIGSENVQAEYFVNIGGMPELQNITVGIDGKIRRDMGRQLLDAESSVSVANAEIAEGSLWGTADRLYLQVPSVWEGSVVLGAENISGQWNDSAVKRGVEKLTGQDLEIDQRIDAALFRSFTVEPFSAADFLEKNSEKLRAVYEKMKVIKVEKAQKEGLLNEEQAGGLEEYVLADAAGNELQTICYLVILPEEELKAFFPDLVGDIRLGVYLDQEKRIVRICTLPGEKLATGIWEGRAALNLTGTEAVVDRLELESTGVVNAAQVLSGLREKTGTVSGAGSSDGAGDSEKLRSSDVVGVSEEPGISDEAGVSDETGIFEESASALDLPGMTEIEGTIILEKNRDVAGSYSMECSTFVKERESVWEFSLEAGMRGERAVAGEDVRDVKGTDTGKSIDAVKGTDTENVGTGEENDMRNSNFVGENFSIEVENLVLKSQGEVVCRGSGEITFAPLEGEIQMPSGKEYWIGEMNELETVVFLAECTKNIYENYSGYMRLMQ